METIFNTLRKKTTVAVAVRYAIAIIGAVLTTAGIVSSTDLPKLIDAVNQLTSGVFTITTALATITPVAIALWKAWFKPAAPVKDLSPQTKADAAHDIAMKPKKGLLDGLFRR